MNHLADPLVRCALMAAWLLPCAWQDVRTRHVSNWMTIPMFVIAWPVALLTGNLILVCAVFVGTWVSWRVGAGIGGADGKIAVGLAAFAPEALLVGFGLQVGVFLVQRMRKQAETFIPGVFWFWVGAMVAAAHQLMPTSFQ
jgi:Flp pilus assembly protein protease CpaA